MTIFSRYLLRQAGGAVVLILLSLSGIVWISLALRELNVVTSMGQSALTLLKMTTLGLPNFMAIIAPFALLIAILHTLNRLNGDSELIVLTAAGATNWTTVRPLLLLALIVSASVSMVNHFVMPWSLRLLKEITVQVRTDLLTQVIQPGRFSMPEPGLTFHIRERTTNGELEGLIMHDARDPKLVQTTLAEHGLIVKQDGVPYLIMTNGHILRRTEADSPSQIIAFQKYAVDLNSFDEKDEGGGNDFRPRERYFSELVHPEPTSLGYKRFPQQFTAELHERFANPFYPIAFSLMALAFIGQAQSTRQGRVQRMAVAFALAVGLRLAGLAANNIVTINTNAVPLLYAIPIAATAVALLRISRATMARSGPTLSERVADVVAPYLAPLVARLAALIPRRRALAEARR